MLWDSDRLLLQLELGEDSRVEFKEAVFSGNRVRAPHRDAIADELAAFGNTIGGTLIFSVSDAGTVGLISRQQMDALETFVGEVCADSIRPPLAFVTQRLALPDGSFVLVVAIEQSALVHKSPGGYLSRRGSTKREMSPEALNRLFQQRGRFGLLGPDEAIIAGTGVNTFDEILADRFLSSRTTEPTTVQLTKLGLVREDDSGVLRATIAGVLLCTTRPDQYLRGAMIEAVRYRGTVFGRASQHDAASITGPLDQQIRAAVNFARLNTRVAARKAPGRIETPQFSPRALFEAIVNAVVHRDYSIENAKIRLFIFDDRLELYSPGALPNTLPIEAMRNRQATRNETLASILRMLAVGDIAGAGGRPALFLGATRRRGSGHLRADPGTDRTRSRVRVARRRGTAADYTVRPAAGTGHPRGSVGIRRWSAACRSTGRCAVSQQDLDGGGHRCVWPSRFWVPLGTSHHRFMRGPGVRCSRGAGLAPAGTDRRAA